jgi:hypothetical protein
VLLNWAECAFVGHEKGKEKMRTRMACHKNIVFRIYVTIRAVSQWCGPDILAGKNIVLWWYSKAHARTSQTNHHPFSPLRYIIIIIIMSTTKIQRVEATEVMGGRIRFGSQVEIVVVAMDG